MEIKAAKPWKPWIDKLIQFRRAWTKIRTEKPSLLADEVFWLRLIVKRLEEEVIELNRKLEEIESRLEQLEAEKK